MENKWMPFLLLLIPQLCLSQDIQFRAWNNSIYNGALDFPPNGVADDFGPRRYNDNWHGGVDYNSAQDDGNNDKWDMILAPEDGTFVDINRLWTTGFSYKQLCYQSGDHRYIFGHVYDNTGASYIENDSTIILRKMIPRPQNPTEKKWAQILIVGNDTLVYGQVIGLVEFNGDTLTTSNTVTAGSPLVPLGDAAAAGSAHLHLNTIPLNRAYSTGATTWNSNPLQYIDYEKADYELSLYSQNNQNNIDIIYPGTIISPMALKVKMTTTVSGGGNKRYNHIFDVDKVKFFIKNRYSEAPYTLIQGSTEESKVYLGGILGESILNHPNPNFGSWSRTGVDSRAYNSGYPNQPYDIYHYSDFITRIHRDDPMDGGNVKTANCPENARYNDGPYQIKSRVIDIRGGYAEGPKTATGILTPIQFNLDNFKPFIQRVNAYIGLTEVYDMQWI